MDDRVRELVAVAAAVAGGCQDCLRQHAAAARRLGVSDDELRQAVDVARAVRLTVSLGMDALAEGVLQGEELKVVSACACGSTCDCQKGA